MALSFIFDAGKGETPQSVAQKRALVQQLMGTGAAPKTFGEGLSALGDGIVANVSGRRANEAESKGQAGANDTFSALTAMLTGQGGATPSAGFSGAPGAVGGSSGGGNSYRDAIASIESAGSGDYNAIGPTNPKLGRALGRYQVMEANIGPWSRAALGREISADEFMASPELQDAIFDHRFGSYVDQYGPQGAAQAWFAGPGGVGKMDRRDVLGTSVSAYTDKFTNAIGGAGGGQPAPVQVASLDPSIGMPQAQPAQLPPIGPSGGPQMAAAPQQPGMVPQTPPMQPQTPMAPQQQPMQTAQGPSLQMLMEAAANPWLNEGQRGIVNSMIAQEMQRQDPRYQQELRAGDLGIQRAEFELNALRNKPPPLPGAPKTEKIYDPETGREKMVQWNERTGVWEDLGGVSAPKEPLVQVNTGGQGPKLGSLSPDYGYVLDPATGEAVIDPATGLPTAAAVPGSPAAQAQEQAAAAAAAQSGSQVTTDVEGAATTLATTRSVLDLLDNSDQPTTGTLSRPFAMYSGSPAGKVRSYVNTLQSGVALGAMQRLKEASATGATGFGALSEKELNILISNIGALDPDNTEPEIFRETVLRIEDQSKRVIADIKRNVSPERIQELGLQPLIDAFGDKPNFDYNSETAPEGWGGDASLWKFLSPEDRALW